MYASASTQQPAAICALKAPVDAYVFVSRNASACMSGLWLMQIQYTCVGSGTGGAGAEGHSQVDGT